MLDRILMGSSAEASDPNFKNVTLLLHGDGSNGAQNNTFIDSSTNNFTITRNGNTTQGSFSPYGSNWSNYFDGSGDYLTITDNTALQMSGDFTWEAWVYPTSLPSAGNYKAFWSQRSSSGNQGGPLVVMDTPGNLLLFVANATASTWSVSGFDTNLDISINAWQHLALVKSGTTLTLYKNGVAGSSATHSTAVGTKGSTALMAGAADGSQAVDGYMSNFRILKGTALYTSNFTPPTAPLTAITNTSLLTCQSNRFIDNSTNNFTITRNGDVKVTNFAPFAPSAAYSTTTNGGSAYFDGTGDYLSGPVSSAFEFGTGDWTMECWVYVISAPSDSYVMDVTVSGGIQILMTLGSGNFYILTNAGGGYSYTNFGAMPVGQWVHLAITRQSNVCYGYINGVKSGTSVSMSTNLTGSYYPSINAYGTKFNGYISNARMVKGTAVYTANFTPTTTPLTAISGTSLLLNGTNAAIFDNSMKNDLETVGNAQISTSVKKFGTGSMAFDGSGDRLSMPATAENRINVDGNFTIEFWAYFNSVASNQRLIAWDDNSTNFVTALYTNTSGNLAYYLSSNGVNWNIAQAISMGSISINTWYHIALVRNGSTFTPYINGVAGTTTTSSATLATSGFPFIIGDTGNGVSPFNGYIDDFRITKGVARYTANFTPPTAAFPNK